MKKQFDFVLLMIAFILTSCQMPDNTKVNLSYDLPDSVQTPYLFAAGKISTNNGICFSNDGNTLLVSEATDEVFSNNGKSIMSILEYNYIDKKWQRGEFLDLGNAFDAYHPVLSFNQDTLYFNSRSHPDTSSLAIPHNVWYSIKRKNIWSSPELHPSVNTAAYDSYPSIAKSGNIYFNSDREGGLGGMDIYVSEYTNGIYQAPVALEAVNSADVENDLFVDRDERFILFNRYFFSTQSIDMFISYRTEEGWTQPIALAKINHTDQWELTPTLSPDGNYFFYELNGQIWQVRLSELLDKGYL